MKEGVIMFRQKACPLKTGAHGHPTHLPCLMQGFRVYHTTLEPMNGALDGDSKLQILGWTGVQTLNHRRDPDGGFCN